MAYNTNNITDRIIKLTLKILHLLFEEDYIVMKESGDQLTVSSPSRGYSNIQRPNMEPPSHSITPEKKNYRKILKATNKITELLTGEVPIRSQDVSVYFSMEEWEYLDRHKQRYGCITTEIHQSDPRSAYSTCQSPMSSLYGMDEDYDIVITATNYSVAGDQVPYFAKMSTPFEGEHLPHHEKHTTQKSMHGMSRNMKNTALCKGKTISSLGDHTYALPYTKSPALLYEQGYQPDLHLDGSSGSTQCSTVDKKEETPLPKEEHIPHSDISSCVDSKEYIAVRIKDDPYICKEEEHLPRTGPSTSEEHNQNISTAIKEETILYEKFPPYSSTYTSSAPVQLNPVHVKEEPMSADEEVPAEIELYVDGTHCPSDHPKKPQKPSQLKQVPSEKRPYSCNECGKRFKTNSGLGSHKKIHEKSKLYTCHDCGDSFFSRIDLVVHRKIHSEEKTYSCGECGRHFSKATNLSNHQRIHATKNPFSCAKCGKRFVSNSNLRRHEKKHDNDVETTEFAGSECGKGITDEHEQNPANDQPYTCTECGRCFIKRINLVKHQRLHTKKNLHYCQDCGKYFMSRAYLLRHMEGHGKKRRPFSCPLCGKFFLNKLDLAIHQRIHKGERPSLASEWRTSFIRKLGFVIQERSSVGENPYFCSECGEQFEKKLQLLRHQKMHNEEKPGGMARGTETNDTKDVDEKCNVLNIGKG